MTIESNLRHAVALETGTDYTVTPAPHMRWIADISYISSSGSPARVQAWSASIGGFHLVPNLAGGIGPKVDDITNQGVFFEQTVNRTLSSSLNILTVKPEGIIAYHTFLVIKDGTNTQDKGVPIGFSRLNNHYVLYKTTANFVTFSHSGSTDAGAYFWGTVLGDTTVASRWRNNQRNLVGFHYRVTPNPPYQTTNSASAQVHVNSTGTPNLFFMQGNIFFGQRLNNAEYSGSIYDVLIYTSSLTNAETGSLINQLNTIWGIW